MSAKELPKSAVKAKYRRAYCRSTLGIEGWDDDFLYCVIDDMDAANGNGANIIGRGMTAPEAWSDAASRIRAQRGK